MKILKTSQQYNLWLLLVTPGLPPNAPPTPSTNNKLLNKHEGVLISGAVAPASVSSGAERERSLQREGGREHVRGVGV